LCHLRVGSEVEEHAKWDAIESICSKCSEGTFRVNVRPSACHLGMRKQKIQKKRERSVEAKSK
jgi:hypothetical protein